MKVADDGVGCPGNRNYSGQGSQTEGGPRTQHQASLDPRVAQAVGAASSQEEDEESQTSQHQADADEASSCLEVRRQVQQGVVELTLHLTRVLTDTSHPQTLPEHLHDHQVGADERGHLPHGQSADQDGPSEADHGEADTQLLQSHGADEDSHTLTDAEGGEEQNGSMLSSFYHILTC